MKKNYLILISFFALLTTLFSQVRTNTTLLGQWSGGRCRAVYAENDIAYFGSGDTLKIVDFTIPSEPAELGSIILPTQLRDVTVNGDYAYVADWTDGLRIINISDPSNPIESGSYHTEGENPDIRAEKIEVRGNYAYLAEGAGGLRILDVSDHANLIAVGYYGPEAHTSSVAVQGNYAYVMDYYGGIKIVDITDPANPDSIGQMYIAEAAENIAVQGNYAYTVGGWNTGLKIIDISDPTNPTQVGQDNKYSSYEIAVHDDFAYIADGNDGLWIIDISNPAQPAEVGWYNAGGSARDVFVNGNIVYVASYDAGLYVIRNDVVLDIDQETNRLPGSFRLKQNYPNPFNPETTIAYHLPSSEYVKLSIYNTTGQLVETLINEHKNAGSHTVKWTDGSVSSGIYFYIITAGQHRDVRKCTVIR